MATVTSAYTTSSAYSSNSSAANPTPTSVYYSVDGSSAWTQVSSGSAANPATFPVTLAATQAGSHVLYVYAAYGNEFGSNSSGIGSGNSPEIGNVTALLFQVDGPLVMLTGSPATVAVGGSVTLAASLSPAAATGTVSFYDTFSGSAVLLGTGTVSGGAASYTASFAAAGMHKLIAVYSGDSTYGASSGTFSETVFVQGTTAQTISFPQPATPALNGKTATLSATASSGLGVTYSVVSGPATVSGSTLSYTGAGTVVVEADQAGNGTYAVASPVQRTVTVVNSNIWLENAVGTLVKLNEASSTASSVIGTAGPASTKGGVAVDSAGNVWSVSAGTNALEFVTYVGASAASYMGGGLNAPASVAVDGAGYVWVANSGGNTVSEFMSSGTAQSGSAGYGSSYVSGDALSAPSAVAVDLTGGVWVANKTGNTVTHIFGAATPVVTPLAAGVRNGTLGTKP